MKAHICGNYQGLHLQWHVSFTSGYGGRPFQGLLGALIVAFGNPKNAAIARKQPASLVGIGPDQSKSPRNELSDAGDWGTWASNWVLCDKNRLSNILCLEVVLERAAESGERFP